MESCKLLHTSHIEVRFAETDQMGVVHHSKYAVWFEQARTEFFMETGSSYAEMEREGFSSPVLELNVRYRNPVRFGDFVDIETTLERKGALHFLFHYKLFVGGKLCTTATTMHCFLKDGRPTREIPRQVYGLFPLAGK